MILSPREAAIFDGIARAVGDPEVRRDRLRMGFAATVIVAAFSMVMMLLNWGWLPVAAFCSTFLPGMAATSAVLHRRLRRQYTLRAGPDPDVSRPHVT